MNLEHLPGGEVVRRGLLDLAAGRESAASLLVEIGGPRLRRLGFEIPHRRSGIPEHRLFELLVANDARRAHSRYNALIRLLVDFERAARWSSS